MPAYMIATRTSPVRDAAAFAEYQRLNRQNAAALHKMYNIKPLVVYGALEAAEGTAPDGMVILQFPTMADARAWYNSPGYQEALPHRQKAADYTMVFAEGFTPPP